MGTRGRRPAAYGGPGWSERKARHVDEIGSVWARCGVSSEWDALVSVLLHAPGEELGASSDPDAVQMLAPVDPARARAEHEALAAAYAAAGVEVHLVAPASVPPPNLLFVADLMFMTPQGAILGRPASTVRAGEERLVARRLADLGVPILRTITGLGTFEGADAAWVGRRTVLLARGLRTNEAGADQVTEALEDQGVDVLATDLPEGTMHLMGQLRFLDEHLAIAWRSGLDPTLPGLLGDLGFDLLDVPDEREAREGLALNLVTLGPRSVLMPAGNPAMEALLRGAGVEVRTAGIAEIARAAGGIGCMTGVLARDAGVTNVTAAPATLPPGPA